MCSYSCLAFRKVQGSSRQAQGGTGRPATGRGRTLPHCHDSAALAAQAALATQLLVLTGNSLTSCSAMPPVHAACNSPSLIDLWLATHYTSKEGGKSLVELH